MSFDQCVVDVPNLLATNFLMPLPLKKIMCLGQGSVAFTSRPGVDVRIQLDLER